jgi:hypothetical protein
MPGRAEQSTVFAEQIVEPFLIVGGFGLVFGRDHAQFGAIDADLGLDIAPARDFSEVANQLLPLFGNGEFREQRAALGRGALAMMAMGCDSA